MTESRDPSGAVVQTGQFKPSNRERDWVVETEKGYDANRYDPEEGNDHCLVCGTLFNKIETRGGGQTSCPECGVTVLLV